MARNAQGGLNKLTGLIPVIFQALQTISRELVGFIPAASRNSTADAAALNQPVRIPKTPETSTRDITPGTPPAGKGTDFGYVDLAITKNKIAEPITWTGDEEIAMGGQLNQMLVNQFAQAMRSLVNEVEKDVCFEGVLGAANAGNVFGTAGSTLFAGGNISELAVIKKMQDDLGTPQSDRHLVINTSTGMALRSVPGLISVAHSGETDMLRRGVLNDLMGYMIRESAGFRTVDPGTQTSIETTAAVDAGAVSLPVTALTGTLNTGALILIGGNYYTVTAPAIAGATMINISPAVKSPIESGTEGTVVSAYLPNVAFSRDFIYLATRTPALPNEVGTSGGNLLDVRTVTDPVSGLSFQITLWEGYREVRIEVGLAWGVKAVNNRHGLLILG